MGEKRYGDFVGFQTFQSCFDAAEKLWNFGLFGRDPSSFGIIKKREDRRVSNWIVARSQAAEQQAAQGIV